jgi:hypothetical protein
VTPEVAAGRRTGKGQMSVRASQALGAEVPAKRGAFREVHVRLREEAILMSEGASQAREREEVIG